MSQGLGFWEFILLTLLLILFFGTQKLPELISGLAKGIHEFKKAIREDNKPDGDSKKRSKS